MVCCAIVPTHDYAHASPGEPHGHRGVAVHIFHPMQPLALGIQLMLAATNRCCISIAIQVVVTVVVACSTALAVAVVATSNNAIIVAAYNDVVWLT